jgi:signal transduction histidine kinase
MSDTLQVAIDRIRSLTFQLSPPLLYDVGLAAAVEALAERFSTDHGLRITVTAEGSASSYLEEISVPLFQMIRELLTNVVKHAQAASVEIRLTDDGKRLTVVVADDGQGFTVEGFGNAGGYGLFSICQRLQHLGGNCDIESSKGGTSVRLWLPLPETGSLQ